MSSPLAPPIVPDEDRCTSTTDAGILDAKLRCSLRAGHEALPTGDEHEAWALPDVDSYAGKAQLLATWTGDGSP